MADRTSPKAPVLGRVASAEGTLALLSAFRWGDSAVSPAEPSTRTELVKSTIMRLAVSLEGAGFLHRTEEAQFPPVPELPGSG